MELLCTNPQIIINPLLPECLHKSSHYCINGKIYPISDGLRQRSYCCFPWKLFSRKRHNPTHDTIESFYMVDSETSEIYPIYIEVCCGKCRICKNQKCSELTTRLLAETSTSVGQVLFIRLSYNNYSLPFEAFSKRHCQLFLKRLRKKLVTLGYDVRLRYFLVSEYGGTYGRPHYHLILWNFPTWDFNLTKIKDMIEDAWSLSISRELYESLPVNFRYCRYIEKWNIGRREYLPSVDYRQRLGYVDVRYYQKKGSSSKAGFDYLCKYVRKEQGEKAHELDVPTFTLSSRRGGLGSAWLEQNRAFYMEHPECIDMEIKVPYDVTPIRCMLPKFFRNKLFPSRSSFIKKNIRDKFHEYVMLWNVKNAITYHFNGKLKHYYNDVDIEIKDKFNMLPWMHMDVSNNYWLRHLSTKFYPALLKKNTRLEPRTVINPFTGEAQTLNYCVHVPHWFQNKEVIYDTFLKRASKVVMWRLGKLYKILHDYEFPYDYDTLTYLRAQHQMALSQFMEAQPVIDVNAYDEYLYREEIRRINREACSNDNE